MKIRAEQITEHLQRTLAPVYYVTGDEPLQLGQVRDQIRQAAQHRGHTDRQVFHAERGFDWQQLLQAADNLSLFAERKLLELRLGSTTPGKEGAQILQRYCESPPPDCVLVITGDKLEAAQQRSAWFTTLEQHGVIVSVWPVDSARLPQWLLQRLKLRELDAGLDAAQCLADHVEGNLLAAEQEIEKLALLYAPGKLTTEQVQQAVADSARFDVFQLVDEALRGDVTRSTRILFGLQAEGTEPVLIVWAMTREIRSLTRLATLMTAGRPVDAALAQEHVWDKRKPLVKQALNRGKLVEWEGLLRRCARLDLLAKGQISGRIWDELLELVLSVTGKAVLRNTVNQR